MLLHGFDHILLCEWVVSALDVQAATSPERAERLDDSVVGQVDLVLLLKCRAEAVVADFLAFQGGPK